MRIRSNEQAVVSIITVILVTIVITVFTLGFLRSSITEQRLATDDDLFVRARLSAESALEDSRNYIRQEVIDVVESSDATTVESLLPEITAAFDTNDECDIETPIGSVLDDEYKVGYSCQIIEIEGEGFTASSVGAYSEMEDRGLILPEGTKSFKIDWHIPAVDGNFKGARENNNLFWPRQDLWGTTAAALRVEVQYRLAAGIPIFTQDVNIINPAKSADGVYKISYLTPIQNARCHTAPVTGTDPKSDDYMCSVVLSIDGAPSDIRLFIRPIYRTTSMKVTAHSISFEGHDYEDFDDSNEIPIKGILNVDVTGYANDVYRRVQAQVNMQPVVESVIETRDGKDDVAVNPKFDSLPNYAILTAERLCKTYTVTDNPDDFTTGGWCFDDS